MYFTCAPMKLQTGPAHICMFNLILMFFGKLLFLCPKYRGIIYLFGNKVVALNASPPPHPHSHPHRGPHQGFTHSPCGTIEPPNCNTTLQPLNDCTCVKNTEVCNIFCNVAASGVMPPSGRHQVSFHHSPKPKLTPSPSIENISICQWLQVALLYCVYRVCNTS